MPDDLTAPIPADDLADLPDAAQVELTDNTDNGLAAEDAGLTQPPNVPEPFEVTGG